jgi:catechol-2,3-dioxygenase
MTIDPRVDIGHVHLKVADIDRALDFYVGVLGFELQQRLGSGAAFISAGGYHHHIGLNTWESQGGSPPHRGATGLYHVAIVYPTRAELADASARAVAARPRLDRGSVLLHAVDAVRDARGDATADAGCGGVADRRSAHGRAVPWRCRSSSKG